MTLETARRRDRLKEGDTVADWVEIRADYISGSLGYRRLAEKYDVSVNALSDHARKEDWPGQRAQYRDKRGTDLVARYARMDRRRMEAVFRASEKMAAQLERMMEDEDAFRKVLVTSPDGKEPTVMTTEIYNTRAMKNTVSMLREMSALIRDLNRIPTQGEAEAQHVARRRLELEEARAQQLAPEQAETGVIEIGEVTGNERDLDAAGEAADLPGEAGI